MAVVCCFDGGLNLGYGVVGGKQIASGSYRLQGGARQMGEVMIDCDRRVREIILAFGPFDCIAIASPFVGMRGGRSIQPDSIRPLFGTLSKIEEIAQELHIRCVEVEEPAARRAFMTGVPRRSADIKDAVIASCRLRGWPASSHHAADALCIASYVLEQLEPQKSHKMTPLFMTKDAR